MMLRGRGDVGDVERMERILADADGLRVGGLLPEAEEAYLHAFEAVGDAAHAAVGGLGLRDARPPAGLAPAPSAGGGLRDPWQWGAFVVVGAG
ncbi:hypothetical protein OHA72_35715 [Dactylosporangium sp. NBC_01737]|uniref:hypothetical protein n=1 Tax=Dactylosporangium sp. NBC_01737 TaxID=2975959 RepID=UPI002E116483|nr:hypothetical protein OHA72_35715 [Dactylosporangium sp. NBC_01737]